MINLIITIIALAVFAGALIAGIGYISVDRYTEALQATEIQVGVQQLSAGAMSYHTLFRKMPSSLGDISPKFAYVPSAPDGMSWSYIAGSPSKVCLSGANANAINYQAMLGAQGKFPADVAFVNTTCGAISNMSAPSSYPLASLAITFRIN